MVASPVKVAVLDDYQTLALQMTGWSPLQGRAARLPNSGFIS